MSRHLLSWAAVLCSPEGNDFSLLSLNFLFFCAEPGDICLGWKQEAHLSSFTGEWHQLPAYCSGQFNSFTQHPIVQHSSGLSKFSSSLLPLTQQHLVDQLNLLFQLKPIALSSISCKDKGSSDFPANYGCSLIK